MNADVEMLPLQSDETEYVATISFEWPEDARAYTAVELNDYCKKCDCHFALQLETAEEHVRLAEQFEQIAASLRRRAVRDGRCEKSLQIAYRREFCVHITAEGQWKGL